MAATAEDHAYLSAETVTKHARVLAAQTDWLERYYPQRQEVIRDLVLALLCEENALLLGAPGTGKSALVDDLVASFYPSQPAAGKLEPDPERVFSYQLSAGTRQEDLVGPYSASGLLEDRFDRLTARTLVEAECAILDEVWKASPETLQVLLAPLNERRFYFGSSQGLLPIRLRSVIAMSNETPDDMERAEALWDRFLFRIPIEDLAGSERAAFLIASVSGEGHAARYRDRPPPLAPQDLAEMRQDVIRVGISRSVAEEATMVFTRFEAEGVRHSTRRLEKAFRVMRAHALMSGRVRVLQPDLRAMAWALWTEDRRPDDFRELVKQLLPDEGTSALTLLKDMAGQAQERFAEYKVIAQSANPSPNDLERRSQLGAQLRQFAEQAKTIQEEAARDAFASDGSETISPLEMKRIDRLTHEIEHYDVQANRILATSSGLPDWLRPAEPGPGPGGDQGPTAPPFAGPYPSPPR